jgi:hypothetical protein
MENSHEHVKKIVRATRALKGDPREDHHRHNNDDDDDDDHSWSNVGASGRHKAQVRPQESTQSKNATSKAPKLIDPFTREDEFDTMLRKSKDIDELFDNCASLHDGIMNDVMITDKVNIKRRCALLKAARTRRAGELSELAKRERDEEHDSTEVKRLKARAEALTDDLRKLKSDTDDQAKKQRIDISSLEVRLRTARQKNTGATSKICPSIERREADREAGNQGKRTQSKKAVPTLQDLTGSIPRTKKSQREAAFAEIMAQNNKSGEKSREDATSAIEHSTSVPTFSPSIDYYNFSKDDKVPDLHMPTRDIDHVKSPGRASSIVGEVEALNEDGHGKLRKPYAAQQALSERAKKVAIEIDLAQSDREDGEIEEGIEEFSTEGAAAMHDTDSDIDLMTRIDRIWENSDLSEEQKAARVTQVNLAAQPQKQQGTSGRDKTHYAQMSEPTCLRWLTGAICTPLTPHHCLCGLASLTLVDNVRL